MIIKLERESKELMGQEVPMNPISSVNEKRQITESGKTGNNSINQSNEMGVLGSIVLSNGS